MDPFAFAKMGATTKQRRISFIISPIWNKKQKNQKKTI